MQSLRIVVHDYSGHPFEVQLSRTLARRGHDVLHLYCPAYVSGKGAVDTRPDDPTTFLCSPVPLPRFDKHSIARRISQELEYGSALARRIVAARPDVVVSANTPLFAQLKALRAARAAEASFVFWLQDVTSAAAARALGDRLPGGSRLSVPIRALERRLLGRSDAVVAISEDFATLLDAWGIPASKVTTVENWAPLDELPQVSVPTRWAAEHGLDHSKVLLYSGTLGLKHNPELLIELARRVKGSSTRVVVISEGVGADRIAAAKESEGLDSLMLLPFQPYRRLPEIFASASVLIAILEQDAGAFSVPSKVLSYLCAGRPIVGALPTANLAARTLERAGAARVVEPHDIDGFVRAALTLIEDDVGRARMGAAGRAYAERVFDAEAITTRFEEVFATVVQRRDPKRYELPTLASNEHL